MTEGPDDDGTGEDGAREVTADAGEREPAEDRDREATDAGDSESTEKGEPLASDATDGSRQGTDDTERGETSDAGRQAERDAGPETVAVETGTGGEDVAADDRAVDGDDVPAAIDTDGADDAGGADEADAAETADTVDDAEAADDTGATDTGASVTESETSAPDDPPRAGDVPPDVRKYDRFKKIDGGTYDRANEFLRDRTYITAREWAIARLCADFRTETGVEMTKIGENLPQLVPFMTDTYTPQAVNQARASFEDKVRKSGATFLYGAMCDFFTAQELDDVMYEATEVAKFLLEVEGVELSVDDELEAEDRISEVMREVREHSAALRHDEMTCPECGHEMNVDD